MNSVFFPPTFIHSWFLLFTLKTLSKLGVKDREQFKSFMLKDGLVRSELKNFHLITENVLLIVLTMRIHEVQKLIASLVPIYTLKIK